MSVDFFSQGWNALKNNMRKFCSINYLKCCNRSVSAVGALEESHSFILAAKGWMKAARQVSCPRKPLSWVSIFIVFDIIPVNSIWLEFLSHMLDIFHANTAWYFLYFFHKLYGYHIIKAYIMFLVVFAGGSKSKDSACNARDLGLIPGLGRLPGGGHGNPLQCSYLENPMGRGAWWATVHGLAKSWTQLRDWAQ